MIVNNKIILTTKYFHPCYVFSLVLTIGFYYFYLYATDSMKDIVMQHYTFYKLLGSPLFYLTCLMPILLCFYIDFMIQAVTVLILTDPQNLIRLYMKDH
jgi:hypothetical protein